MESCIRGHHIFKNIWTPNHDQAVSFLAREKSATIRIETGSQLAMYLLLLVPCFSRGEVLFIASSQENVAILVSYLKEIRSALFVEV